VGARKETTTRPVNLKDSRNSSSRPAKAQAELAAFREQLSRLYFGDSRVAQQFRYGLLVFDAVTIAFIVGTSFLPRTTWLEWLDVIFGLIILIDFSARLFVSPHPVREFAHPATWADMGFIVRPAARCLTFPMKGVPKCPKGTREWELEGKASVEPQFIRHLNPVWVIREDKRHLKVPLRGTTGWGFKARAKLALYRRRRICLLPPINL